MAVAAIFLGQARPPEIRIVQPVVDKAAGTVTVPAMFWNSNSADWVEVALCGRPSDFLHETVLAVSTTRTLLEQAFREAGFRDGDAWADNADGFPRVRGDRFMVILEFQRDGKREIFSLDELLAFQQWGVASGPFGFNFRGDPGRTEKPASRPAASETDGDAARILRDDPQIALQFKGLQSMSQSFADHPLAYADWEYETINWSRNYSLLPRTLFNSNGDIPVTVTFRRVNEEQLLTESARLWHDAAAREAILQRLPIAREIDKAKAEYAALRVEAAALRAVAPELRDREKELLTFGRLAVLAAEIERYYAALNAAWVDWAAEHARWETTEERAVTQLNDQRKRWQEHMTLEATRTMEIAKAEAAAFEIRKLNFRAESAPLNDDLKTLLNVLRGSEIVARSRALEAQNKQPTDRWAAEKARLDPQNDPRDVWIKNVELQVQLTQERKEAALAGIAFGEALKKSPQDAGEVTRLSRGYLATSTRAALTEEKLDLVRLEFEISKHEAFENDPDLPILKRQRDQVLEAIKGLNDALSQIGG